VDTTKHDKELHEDVLKRLPKKFDEVFFKRVEPFFRYSLSLLHDAVEVYSLVRKTANRYVNYEGTYDTITTVIKQPRRLSREQTQIVWGVGDRKCDYNVRAGDRLELTPNEVLFFLAVFPDSIEIIDDKAEGKLQEIIGDRYVEMLKDLPWSFSEALITRTARYYGISSRYLAPKLSDLDEKQNRYINPDSKSLIQFVTGENISLNLSIADLQQAFPFPTQKESFHLEKGIPLEVTSKEFDLIKTKHPAAELLTISKPKDTKR
jgi:hypothetical protein